MTPEASARQTIDALLMRAGCHVCNMSDAYIHAGRGVIEARQNGSPLTCIEIGFPLGAYPLPIFRSGFAFHRPEALVAFVNDTPAAALLLPDSGERFASSVHQFQDMPISARMSAESEPALGASQIFLTQLHVMWPLIVADCAHPTTGAVAYG